MPAKVHGLYRRPLLGLERPVTSAACAAEGLTRGTTRTTPIRRTPEFASATASSRCWRPSSAPAWRPPWRAAELLRDDADALDAWADRAYSECVVDR